MWSRIGAVWRDHKGALGALFVLAIVVGAVLRELFVSALVDWVNQQLLLRLGPWLPHALEGVAADATALLAAAGLIGCSVAIGFLLGERYRPPPVEDTVKLEPMTEAQAKAVTKGWLSVRDDVLTLAESVCVDDRETVDFLWQRGFEGNLKRRLREAVTDAINRDLGDFPRGWFNPNMDGAIGLADELLMAAREFAHAHELDRDRVAPLPNNSGS